nr:MarR family winged helix-turn-helix transcriptional regulator [Micromonospora sp. DSM 115978]
MVEQSEPPGVGDPAALGWSLHHLAVASVDVDVVLAERLGLGFTDYLAMKHLMTSPTPMGPVELGKLLGISSGSATGLVDRLERAGHVERHRHPDDRRRQVVLPTDATTRRISAALDPLADLMVRLADEFTPQERIVIERFLTRAVECHHRFRAAP